MLQVVLLASAVALGAAWLLGLLGKGSLWKRLGIPEERGFPLVGNYGGVVIQTVSISDELQRIYRKHANRPFVGLYEFRKPALLIRDPEMAKNILTRDFSSFHENAFDIDAKLDPLLARNPFFLSGERWKKVRSQLSPAFSTGRLRLLLPPIRDIAQEMVAYAREHAPATLPDGFDAKELAAKFTTEVVSSVAFGVRANSFKDEHAEIRSMGRRILQIDFLKGLFLTLQLAIPALTSVLRMSIVPKDVDRFFRELVQDAVRHREEQSVQRNDFLQLLLGIKQKALEAGDNTYGNEEITAHTITFFTDGFETSSVALSFLMHDLAGNPRAQQRLREELAALPPSDTEALLRLPYLEACLMESLRLHPPAGFMQKRVTAPAPLRLPSGGEAVLPVGTSVMLPIHAWHADPAFFPDPHAFRPERFLRSEGEGDGEGAGVAKDGGAPPGAFMPFGDGPRQCIGMRFAQMQVKAGAAALVSAFELRRTARSPPDPVPQDPKNFLTAAKGGLWVRLEPLASA